MRFNITRPTTVDHVDSRESLKIPFKKVDDD